MAKNGRPHKSAAAKKATKQPASKVKQVPTAMSVATASSAPLNTRKMVPAWTIAHRAIRLVWSRKGLFGGVLAIYALLNLALVNGLANSSTLTNLQVSSRGLLHGHISALGSSLGNFALLFGSAGGGSAPGGGVWQFTLLVVTSLAIIWGLRQAQNRRPMRIRDTFYSGVYPFVPFVILLFVIGVELLPMTIVAALYSVVSTSGIAAHTGDKLFWGALLVAGTILSLYLICTSIIALYIVTLPDMTPLKALRSARDLVRGRRLLVLRKILFLPIVLLVSTAIILLPSIAISSGLTLWIFFVADLLTLLAVHAYLYMLYRDLLDE